MLYDRIRLSNARQGLRGVPQVTPKWHPAGPWFGVVPQITLGRQPVGRGLRGVPQTNPVEGWWGEVTKKNLSGHGPGEEAAMKGKIHGTGFTMVATLGVLPIIGLDLRVDDLSAALSFVMWILISLLIVKVLAIFAGVS